MLAHGEREDVAGRLVGDLGGVVPKLEEGVQLVVHGEHGPEAVRLEQLRQRAALPLVVRQPLQKAVLRADNPLLQSEIGTHPSSSH